MWLDEQRSSNPLRIPHPKFDKLAYQTQGGVYSPKAKYASVLMHTVCMFVFLPNHFITFAGECQ